jgi:hypothetical protein
MTKYAVFDATKPAPQRVMGWIDTRFAKRATMPAAADLLVVNDAQYAQRKTGEWAVSAGALVPYVAPVPTPAEALASAQAAQAAKLRAACAAVITGGFTCSALAPGYLYASTATDQANLAAAAIVAASAPAGWSTPIWCEPSPGAVWEFEEHDSSQVQQVHAACQAMIAGARAQLKVLLGQMQAAATPAAVAAVVWPAA